MHLLVSSGGSLKRLLSELLKDEAGQDMAEYAVLIGLIALAVVFAVRFLGGSIRGVFNGIGGTFESAGIPTGGS